MTRSECEKKIESLILEIRDTVNEYDPSIDHLSVCIGRQYSWAFTLDRKTMDDSDESKYLLKVDIFHPEFYEDLEDEGDDDT